jgi:hypothetical protein
MTERESTVRLRRYAAESYDSALDAFEADLERLAEAGWFPIAQCWGWDSESSAAWLVGGSSWKPGPGTLAVTYRLESKRSS